MMTNTSVQDENVGHRVCHVIQGSHAISDEPDVVLTTILGSCVATCLWDPIAAVGGMNHFLLANEPVHGGPSYRYGSHAMELLINDLLKKGARRDRLRAKLFGGATMQNMFGKIGQSNADFAVNFLKSDGIEIVSQSLGGTQARRIRFVPTIGYAQQLLVPEHDLPKSDAAPIRPAVVDDITFF